MEEKRFFGEVVGAMLFQRPNGDILLVGRGEGWSFPTGHLDPNLDRDLIDTLFRESAEELFEKTEEGDNLENLGIEISILGVKPIKASEEGKKDKTMVTYHCKVGSSTAEKIQYSEKGETRQMWINPLAAIGISHEGKLSLDQVAQDGLDFYVDKLTKYSSVTIIKLAQWQVLKFFEKLKLIFRKSP